MSSELGEKVKHEQEIEERKKRNVEKVTTHRHHTGNKLQTKSSGRRLPNLPSNSTQNTNRRLSSSSSSSEGYTPPGSGHKTKTSRRNLTGPSSASTSSLSSYGSIQHLSAPGTGLKTSKKNSVSTNNLSENRLTVNENRAKCGDKDVPRRNISSTIPKARSMNAIHHVGGKTSAQRPPCKKGKPKAKPVHHAGTNDEAEATRALAEHRKRIREEVERKALLDKERQEELRCQCEEEEQRLAEENGKF